MLLVSKVLDNAFWNKYLGACVIEMVVLKNPLIWCRIKFERYIKEKIKNKFNAFSFPKLSTIFPRKMGSSNDKIIAKI
jgi:hypothetical protein